MKLFYSPTSPYARKARILIREVGLAESVTEVAENPYAEDATVSAHNPLGKVPTLLTDAGEALYDSPVICEYLDSVHQMRKIYPTGDARWPALRSMALADGIMDAVVAIRLESLRPPELRYAPVVERNLAAIRRALDSLAKIELGTGHELDIGQISLGCAFGYLDLRLSVEDWRAAHSGLAGWYATLSARPSLVETAHPDSP